METTVISIVAFFVLWGWTICVSNDAPTNGVDL